MSLGGKYKWKPDSNPPPGIYNPNADFIKPSVKSSVNLSPSKSKRTDFTDSPMKEVPDAGLYENNLRTFGSDVKTKVTFGSKYKTKYNNNPPPGIYDPDKSLNTTLPKTRSTIIRNDNWKRSNFTDSPTRENPDAGLYNSRKDFGSDLKYNPMTRHGKYDFKPNDNPPPGMYDIDASVKLTKPSIRGAVIKDVQKFEVYE